MTSRTSGINQTSASQLLERFRTGFQFKLAISDDDKRRVFHLRHKVYCEELGYEEPSDEDAKLEFDEHDSHSLHCLIEHRRSGEAAGCMRLVFPDEENFSSDRHLPLQSYAGQSLTHESLHPKQLDRDKICEISRLAVGTHFRRKSVISEIENSLNHDFYQFTTDERQTFPVIVVGLFLATYALVGLSNRRHVFAMMEPRLPRLLSMSGFHFTQVGSSIDFHGKRSAFYIDQKKAEKEIHEELLPLYWHIKNELSLQTERTNKASTLAAML
ncbi:PEP-CTERM/exosortase system-associated acyltransferase [Halomonas sp. RA08-2]|uniref:PEP-CTERM/exosortase system-associated acyltransferase n=1 Tax=Halomonas sp. RA08-2 TaxID=3440842 RepID=UPI003EEE89F4